MTANPGTSTCSQGEGVIKGGLYKLKRAVIRGFCYLKYETIGTALLKAPVPRSPLAQRIPEETT